MNDLTAIERWLEGYLTAWDSDAPDDIARLFAPDAHYYSAPFRDPHVGTEEIVRWWIGQENSTIEWEFQSEIIARSGDLYVVRGVTCYPGGLETPGNAEVFYNLWLVTLDSDGRAREFIEYWMVDDTEESA